MTDWSEMQWVVRLEDPNGTIATQTFSTGHDAARYAIARLVEGRLHRKYIDAVIYINDPM